MTVAPINFEAPGAGANGAGGPSFDDGPDAPSAHDERPALTIEALAIAVTSAWFEKRPPPRAWLLRDGRRVGSDNGVLPLGKVGQVIAAGGVGKTMLVCQLALAVGSGSPWLDTFAVAPEGKGRVLLILGEEDAEEVQRRIHNAQRGRPGAPDDGAVVVLPFAGIPCAMLERDENRNTRETGFLHGLRDYLTKEAEKSGQPWKLIVIDPLSRFAGPDGETDNAAGTRFVQALESLAKLTGATVLFTHHTNKLSRGDGAEVNGTSGRGSSSLFDGARWEASLSHETVKLEDPETRDRLGELVTLAFTKSNYSRRAEPVKLRRDVGGPLVALDDVDRETVSQAKDTKATKADRKKDENQKRCEEDDAAARTLWTENPGKSLRTLKPELMKRLGCGGDRAQHALSRTRPSDG